MCRQRGQCLGRQPSLPLIAAIPFAQDVKSQFRDVRLAVTEWWQRYCRAETLVQVLAKGAARDHGPEVPIRRGNNSNVHLDRLAFTNRLNFTLLERPQQLRLRCQRQLSKFIEEKRAAICRFEFSRVIGCCTSERSFAVAEELAFRELRGDAAAVYDYEWPGRPRT